jgi:hypothetical protein
MSTKSMAMVGTCDMMTRLAAAVTWQGGSARGASEQAS